MGIINLTRYLVSCQIWCFLSSRTEKKWIEL